jgi:DNA-binding transcriptional LysR family regulator
MDRLGAMSVFVSVVSAGSFSGASRELRMPLPTVSRRVAELEAHLDAKLLIRGTRKLALTDAGEAYLAACRRVLDAVAEAERGAAGEYNTPQGDLVMTAPVTFGRMHVVPVAAEFLAYHPRVDLHLVLSDRPMNLIDDHLDIALRIGELPDSSLVAARIGKVRSVVCASPAYLQRCGTPKTPEALANHECVNFAALGAADSWRFPDRGEIRIHSRLVVSTAEAALEAAMRGVGLTRLLSYQAASAAEAGKLVVVLRKFEPAAIPVSLIYVRERRVSGKLRAFLDFAAPRLRARLEKDGD